MDLQDNILMFDNYDEELEEDEDFEEEEAHKHGTDRHRRHRQLYPSYRLKIFQ